MTAALLWLALIAAVTGGLWGLSRRPPHVTVTREVPGSGFEGGGLPLTVTVTVRSRRPCASRSATRPARRGVRP